MPGNVSPSSSSAPRLGPYEIVAPLGAGGMGEVFRAVDTRVGRTVALKRLPVAVAADPERLARFAREARLLAALNHPNVAQLYGFETATSDGADVHLIAMELVEGESLADRMAHGPVPVAEALPLARQIAEALEHAHEKGIVHRDLKPENVKLTPDGAVKVLDFGLAKAFAGEGQGSAPDLSQSPTLVAAGTHAGVILGTAAYMSPEQARGRPVDKRTDVWAFGVVLFEMLSGTRLFHGETVSDVLAAVLTREIDWSRLPAATPAALRRLLRLSLDRNPRNRLHDIADARIALAELEQGGPVEADTSAAGPERRGRSALRWAGLPLLGALIGGAAVWIARPAPAPLPTYRRLTNDSGMIYSARFVGDGTTVVYGEANAGAPVSVFSTPADRPAPRRFDWPNADVVGVSRNGEAALILDRHYTGSWLRIGTLAQASLSGGTPRALLESVYDADISPDGASFAVVRDDGGGQQLEFPPGKVLYRATGWISSPRIAADARRIAFIDHPQRGDDQGFVTVVDLDGKAARISRVLNFLHGVAWSPGGREVYASFGDIEFGTALEAFRPDGSSRALLNFASLVRLHDVSPSGRILISSELMQVATQGRVGAGTGEYFATMFGESFAGISQDGRIIAGSSGALRGGTEYQAFYRESAWSAPVLLGDGSALGVTADGRWVFVATVSRDRSTLRAEPTGPGQTRRFDLAGVEVVVATTERVSASADGSRIGFLGAVRGAVPRGYVFDLEAKQPPRAVTPEGARYLFLSPRGDAMVGLDAAGALRIFPVDGGPPRPVPGSAAGEIPVAWTSAGDAVFVWDRTLPARVARVDLATGKREPAFEWSSRDPSTLLYGLLTVSTDARYHLMRYRRGVSSLALADGVR